jgi:hypothetical protein
VTHWASKGVSTMAGSKILIPSVTIKTTDMQKMQITKACIMRGSYIRLDWRSNNRRDSSIYGYMEHHQYKLVY